MNIEKDMYHYYFETYIQPIKITTWLVAMCSLVKFKNFVKICLKYCGENLFNIILLFCYKFRTVKG